MSFKKICDSLEELIQYDPGHRGISKIHVPGELYQSVCHIRNSKHIVLATGFPCNPLNPPTESDGPPGIIILAYSLLKHDPQRYVTIITDEIHSGVMESLIKHLKTNFDELKSRLSYVVCKGNKNISLSHIKSFFDKHLSQPCLVDHMIAVELSGYNNEKKYKTMRNNDISDKCSFTANLFDYAFKYGVCKTTGVGDGGNEVGMGKFKSNIIKYVTFGKDIACDIKTDYCITAGVSNWGAEAIAAALSFTSKKVDCLCSLKFHHDIYLETGKAGAADGINKRFDGSVDGMEYKVHQQMWKKMCHITQQIVSKL